MFVWLCWLSFLDRFDYVALHVCCKFAILDEYEWWHVWPISYPSTTTDALWHGYINYIHVVRMTFAKWADFQKNIYFDNWYVYHITFIRKCFVATLSFVLLAMYSRQTTLLGLRQVPAAFVSQRYPAWSCVTDNVVNGQQGLCASRSGLTSNSFDFLWSQWLLPWQSTYVMSGQRFDIKRGNNKRTALVGLIDNLLQLLVGHIVERQRRIMCAQWWQRLMCNWGQHCGV